MRLGGLLLGLLAAGGSAAPRVVHDTFLYRVAKELGIPYATALANCSDGTVAASCNATMTLTLDRFYPVEDNGDDITPLTDRPAIVFVHGGSYCILNSSELWPQVRSSGVIIRRRHPCVVERRLFAPSPCLSPHEARRARYLFRRERILADARSSFVFPSAARVVRARTARRPHRARAIYI